MAWRDGRRRRTKGTAGAGGREPAAGPPGTGSGAADGSAAASSGAPAAASVPGDWDGGWRRTPPPPLTVARAPLGVSDGLAFRSGLASWQNPTLGTGLGHALLPSAPVGLVHGVTRPAAPLATRSDGGPLLLRVARTDAAPETPDPAEGGRAATPRSGRAAAPGSGPGGNTPVFRARSGSTATPGPSSGPAGPRTERTETAQPPRRPAVTPSERGTVADAPLTPVAAPESAVRRFAGAATGADVPPVRRIAVVPHASGGASRVSTPADSPSRGAAPVRPAPLGPPLTVARRTTTGPVRRITALRPEATATASPATPAAESAPPAPPVQRAGGRATLGAPLGELPATARPLLPEATRATGGGADTHAASGPGLPVVQRQSDTPALGPAALSGPAPSPASSPPAGASTPAPSKSPDRPTAPHRPAPSGRPGRSGAPARAGLGAPLPAMPPTADLPGGAASGRRPAAPGVQRSPHTPGTPTVSVPLLGAAGSGRPGTGADRPLSEGSSAPAAPKDPAPALVTRVGSQAAPAAGTAPVHQGPPAAVPLAGPTTPSKRRTSVPARVSDGASVPVVVARSIAPFTTTPSTAAAPGTHTNPGPAVTRTPSVIGGQPFTVGRPDGRTASPAPRTLALLAARPLGVHTRAPEGVAPSSQAARRPVVAASWHREPPQAPGPVPVSTARRAPGATPAPAVQRAPTPAVQRAPAANPPARPGAPQAPGQPPTPPVQRARTGQPPSSPHRPPAAVAGHPDPLPSRPVPVVRPDPPGGRTVTGGAAARPHVLPVSDPAAPPLSGRPPVPPASTAVPVVRATRAATAPPVPGVGPAVPRRTGGPAAPAVQRAVAGAGGVPAGVPVRERQRSASAPPPAARGKPESQGAAAPKEPGIDLDDLARRLLEPMSRLLRADLRRGRERAGRPYDGRR